MSGKGGLLTLKSGVIPTAACIRTCGEDFTFTEYATVHVHVLREPQLALSKVSAQLVAYGGQRCCKAHNIPEGFVTNALLGLTFKDQYTHWRSMHMTGSS